MVARLFIAEKPSLGEAIASELGITKKERGFFQCGNDVVTWCFGHMLEQAGPDEYTDVNAPVDKSGNKIWRAEDLPIIPEEWILHPKEDAKHQLSIIEKLIKSANSVVHAGDPDREGQLLVDEILEFYGYSHPVKRLWTQSVDSTSMRRALNDLRKNEDYRGFGAAAQARGKADWLIGMNLTRAYTLKAARGGTRALLVVGRVQTPVLSLVVDRDREIEAFKPIPFYKIKAVIQHGSSSFIADWNASDDQIGLDSEGRLVDANVAKQLIDKISGSSGFVTEYKKVPTKKNPPTAYSLSSLTIKASSAYGYSAQDVLDVCQSLYETHKLTSYPRTDCKYLPEAQHADAIEVLEAIKHVNPDMAILIDGANPKLKSKTWNDSAITAHHGLIPTLNKGSKEKLNEKELNIYLLIVRSYLAQFYPAHEYLKTTIKLKVGEEVFETGGNTVTLPGWKEVFSEGDDDDNSSAVVQTLPPMNNGDEVKCIKSNAVDSKTKAPSRFSDGSLVAAMENIHKYVNDPELKKLLRDGDGIGTPATRASIISELKRRGYLEEKGKFVISTPLGRGMVDVFPVVMKNAVLTALNEKQLLDIQKNPDNQVLFINSQIKFITDQVAKANDGSVRVAGAKQSAPVSKVHMCKSCGKGLCRRPGKKPNSFFWSCSDYPNCKQLYPDYKGKPNYTKGKE